MVNEAHTRQQSARGIQRPVVLVAVLLVGAILGAQTQPSTYRETIPGTLVSFEMVAVPGSATQPAFHMSRTEVTWDLYDVYALSLDTPDARPAGVDAVARPSSPYGAPDYGWGHAGFPVISVTRQAAESFTKWLSLTTGQEYRLPTDAEWQHAATLAGAGDVTIDALAWHAGNADARTHAVGTRKPDALGLFDLFGNAAEWVMTEGDDFVTRGGSFRDAATVVGPTARGVQDDSWNERDPQLPKSQWWLSDAPHVGFRLVRGVRQ
jgi:formylglycine-generating enzyme required for sulfatase activity